MRARACVCACIHHMFVVCSVRVFGRSPHNVPTNYARRCIIYNNNNNSSNFTGRFSVPRYPFVRCAYTHLSAHVNLLNHRAEIERNSGDDAGDRGHGGDGDGGSGCSRFNNVLFAVAVYILFNNLTFFLILKRRNPKEEEEEKNESPYIFFFLFVVSSLQFCVLPRKKNNASGSNPPPPPRLSRQTPACVSY